LYKQLQQSCITVVRNNNTFWT